MDPSDFDNDGDGLSLNELPPSVRQRAMGAMGFTRPDMTPQAPQPTGYVQQPGPSTGPMPIEQYQASQPGLQTPGYGVPDASAGGNGGALIPNGGGKTPSTDNTPWIMVGAVAVLGAIGWWAYSKMEKDKKIRVGPPRMGDDGGYGRGRGDDYDDGDDGLGYDDDGGDDGGALDAYAKVKKPRKMVDPHEKGGIKLVKG